MDKRNIDISKLNHLNGKNVAIIGGGPSGLASAKSCCECGLVPTIFEKNLNIGGVWAKDQSKVWNTMRTNISKYSCCFSDFPPKQVNDDDIFFNQAEMYEYLYDYGKKFDILKYVNSNCLVKKVSRVKIDNIDKWKIQWIDNNIDKTKVNEKLYDYVIIATGINCAPSEYKQMSLLENFKGNIIHSMQYRTPDYYLNKKVLVIGNGFSGSQIVTEVSSTAKSVHQIVRRTNQWVLPDLPSFPSMDEPNKMISAPFDIMFSNRKVAYEVMKLPLNDFNQFLNNSYKNLTNNNENSEQFKYDEEFEFPPYFVIANDYIQSCENGNIQLRKNYSLKSVNGNEIIIQSNNDNNIEECLEFDEIILCTGYKTDLTYLDKEIQDEINYNINDYYVSCILHKNVFPKNFKNIGFVGIINGSNFYCIELMARWVSLVFSGISTLPNEKEIDEGIKKQLEIRNSDKKSRHQFTYIDPVIFGDELAKEVGCLPDFDEIKSNDPELFDLLWNSFFCNSSYRLTGHFSNPSLAKDNINFYKNIYKKNITPK